MRMAQIYGLKGDARKFLVDNVEQIPEYVCKCGETFGSKWNKKIIETDEDVGFGTKLEMWEYKLKDGRIVREVKNKYTPWSSGPCIFLNLIDSITGEKIFTWTEEEIDVVV